MPMLLANASAPRRQCRTSIAVIVDLTVTPPYTGAVAGGILSGEMLYRTANYQAASLATPGASNANAASFIGIAEDQYPQLIAAGIYDSPVFGDPNVPMVSVYEDGDHLMNATAGDVYQPYMPVYVGADGRTIQLTASGTSIGYVSPDQRAVTALPNPARGLTFGTAATAGQQIYIHIVPVLAK
jgi:hypothetical protein